MVSFDIDSSFPTFVTSNSEEKEDTSCPTVSGTDNQKYKCVSFGRGGVLSLYTKEVVVLDKGGWCFPGDVLFSPETKSARQKLTPLCLKLRDSYVSR